MKETPLISIIVPVYNSKNSLPKCLDSLLQQTLQDIEVIALDDASTDGSLDLLQKYAASDERVKVFSDGNNLGPGRRRNQGISQARGKYIMMVDSDDWLEQDACRQLAEKVKEVDYDAVSFNAYIDYQDKSIENNYYQIKQEFCGTWRDVSSLIFKTPFHSCHWLYKRSFLEKSKVAYSECSFLEDAPFVLSVLMKADNILFYPQNLYHYVQNDESIVHKQSDKFMSIFDVVTAIDAILAQAGQKEAFKTQLQKWIERHINFCSNQLSFCLRPIFLQRLKKEGFPYSPKKLFLSKKIKWLGIRIYRPDEKSFYCCFCRIKIISGEMRAKSIKIRFLGFPILKITKTE